MSKLIKINRYCRISPNDLLYLSSYLDGTERIVLEKIANGAKRKDIAAELRQHPSTIATKARNAFHKAESANYFCRYSSVRLLRQDKLKLVTMPPFQPVSINHRMLPYKKSFVS